MKNVHIFSPFLLLLLAFTSCASQKRASNAYDSGGRSGENLKQTADDQGNSKKVIYSTNIDLTVKIPDSASLQIGNIAKKYNGYVQQSGTYSCVIRVEEKHLKTAVEEICLLGRVESKNSFGEDVTDQYSDYAIRLENAEKARERYLELLARAENVQAALLVEKELERLNETIELMKGQMNRIDHLVSYSTITVYLKEKKKPGIVGYIGIGLYRAVKWLFVRN